MPDHKSWKTFAEESPDLAEAGKALLYQDAEFAAAYLATVAPDGAPRVHPVFPVLALDQLWLFIVNLSPKYRDLRRNGCMALHTFPTPGGGKEFHVRGKASEVADPETRRRIVDATGGRQGNQDFEALFRCELQSVLYTEWEHWGTERAWPSYTKWRA